MASLTNISPRPLEEILDEVVYEKEAMEIFFTDQTHVACQGPGGALGHPKVFYTIGDKGYAECGYCDRIFVFDPARAGTVYEGGYEGSAPADGPIDGAKSLPEGSPALSHDSDASS
ncbi:MAG: zinc-finger domain-containing protein [Pseudomonadota bacterium]